MDQFVCVYQTAVGIISQVEFASHSVSYGKFVSSQSSQLLSIFICVGKFMHPVYITFQTVLLQLNSKWIEV
jgi:hypothetical protein